MSMVDLYIQLIRQKRELEAALRKIDGKIEKTKSLVVEEMAAEGIDKVTKDGFTVYTKKQHYCRLAENIDQLELVRSCQVHGLGDLVTETVNMNRMRSYINDLDEHGDSLPDDVRRCLAISEERIPVARKV